MVPAAVNPAGKDDGLRLMGEAEVAAIDGALHGADYIIVEMPLFFALLLSLGAAWAIPPLAPDAASEVTVTTATATNGDVDPEEPEQPFSADEGEAKSGSLMTPTAAFTVKKPYDQARERLQQAADLWQQGKAEAASDTALEAYDDLLDVHFPRKQKKARAKLRAERQKAAQVYIDASIAFIKEAARKKKNSPAARQEARERLGDLRDVSREYPDLNAKVSSALEEFR